MSDTREKPTIEQLLKKPTINLCEDDVEDIVKAYLALRSEHSKLAAWVEKFRDKAREGAQQEYFMPSATIELLLAELEAILPKES